MRCRMESRARARRSPRCARCPRASSRRRRVVPTRSGAARSGSRPARVDRKDTLRRMPRMRASMSGARRWCARVTVTSSASRTVGFTSAIAGRSSSMIPRASACSMIVSKAARLIILIGDDESIDAESAGLEQIARARGRHGGVEHDGDGWKATLHLAKPVEGVAHLRGRKEIDRARSSPAARHTRRAAPASRCRAPSCNGPAGPCERGSADGGSEEVSRPDPRPTSNEESSLWNGRGKPRPCHGMLPAA